jgi:hypothetical protein
MHAACDHINGVLCENISQGILPLLLSTKQAFYLIQHVSGEICNISLKCFFGYVTSIQPDTPITEDNDGRKM